MPNSIPFLRDVRDTGNVSWNKHGRNAQNMFTLTPTTIGKDLGAGMGVRRTKSRDLRKRK